MKLNFNISLNKDPDHSGKTKPPSFTLLLGVVFLFLGFHSGWVEMFLSKVLFGYFTDFISSLGMIFLVSGTILCVVGASALLLEVGRNNKNDASSKKTTNIIFWILVIFGLFPLSFFLTNFLGETNESSGLGGLDTIGLMFYSMIYIFSVLAIGLLLSARNVVDLAKQSNTGEGHSSSPKLYFWIFVFFLFAALLAPFFMPNP